MLGQETGEDTLLFRSYGKDQNQAEGAAQGEGEKSRIFRGSRAADWSAVGGGPVFRAEALEHVECGVGQTEEDPPSLFRK